MDIFEYLQVWFSGVWDLYSVKYPGFDFSFGDIAIGVLCIVLGLKLLSVIIGFNFSPVSIAESIGGNRRKIKVSDSRRGDVK